MIEVRRLRVLRALADHGTVTAAAEVLHLTPSAVSQQLAALESEVGQELLERRGRRVAITSAGRLLLAHTDTILTEVERAEDAMRLYANGTTGEVRVTAFATAISLLVAPTSPGCAKPAPASTSSSATPKAIRASPICSTARPTSNTVPTKQQDITRRAVSTGDEKAPLPSPASARRAPRSCCWDLKDRLPSARPPGGPAIVHGGHHRLARPAARRAHRPRVRHSRGRRGRLRRRPAGRGRLKGRDPADRISAPPGPPCRPLNRAR